MRHLFLIFFITSLHQIVKAQDPEFSQFFANPLHLNPAFAGTTELSRVVVNYRNQWPQKGTTYSTYSLSFDQLFKKLNAGIGVQVYRDQELNDVVKTSSALLSYSYHLKFNGNNFATLGLQTGLVYKQFDPGRLIFPSGIDQLTGDLYETLPYLTSAESKIYPDFAIGAVFQKEDYFGGISVHHLNQPDESIINGDQKGKLPAKYTLHAGARTHHLHHGLLSRVFTLSPNILYQQQGSFKQLNLGIYMIEDSFIFGGWYRNNIDIRPDAFIVLAGLATNRFQVGYSFDFTISELSNYSYGSHEISLTFFLGSKKEIPERDKLLIPMI